jgi:hypothetical protein
MATMPKGRKKAAISKRQERRRTVARTIKALRMEHKSPLEALRSAATTLAQIHRDRADELGLVVAGGYPRWNNGDMVHGPRQEFYFRLGDNQQSMEPVGTREMLLYAEGDKATRLRLNALMRHLCGNPS